MPNIITVPKRKFTGAETGDFAMASMLPVTFESKVLFGLNANKPTNPAVGNIWVATDTSQTYVCYTAGIWTLL
uniref:Uncharacterized protein n=1 Tax=viral metagenome TaxID=1070528 RepID=A0A6H1Z8A3_9ZZZZ